MYNNMHEVMRDRYANKKLEISEQLAAVDHILEVVSESRDEHRAEMEKILSAEVKMMQKDNPKAVIGLVIEPDMVTAVKTISELKTDYFSKEFEEPCFSIGEGIVGLFDEDDVAVEKGIPYLCGPMFIVGMDEYGNLCSVDDEGIKDVLDFLDMNTVDIENPDDESLDYSIFRLI